MSNWNEFQLSSGRVIRLTAIDQWGTYSGLLEGFPTMEKNERPFRPQILFLHRFPGPQGPGWTNSWPTWAARPRAGMQRPVGPLGQDLSQRDKAHQPRATPATPWGFNAPDSRVLKERRISLDGEHVYDQLRFGAPSERERFTTSVPGVAPGVVPGG